jgi:hypothetical protein
MQPLLFVLRSYHRRNMILYIIGDAIVKCQHAFDLSVTGRTRDLDCSVGYTRSTVPSPDFEQMNELTL